MTFATPWALAALALLAPIVLLHLRRRRARRVDVPALLIWRELAGAAGRAPRRLRLPALPVLLALQALAVIALVLALGRLGHRSAGQAGRRTQVFVVDESLAMGADGRMARARQVVAQGKKGQTPFSTTKVVLAGAQPSWGSVAAARPEAASPDLAGALELAAGALHRRGDRIVLLRAPEDAPPPVDAPRGAFADEPIGGAVDDQGLQSPAARCGPAGCEVFAVARNDTPAGRTRRLVVRAGTRTIADRTLVLPARSQTGVALRVPVGGPIELALAGRDALAADDRTWAIVPAPAPARVTVVGDRATALPLARALAAVPGVRLTVRGAATYRAADAAGADLLVLVGRLPAAVPPRPALLLVDPPRLPGGVAGRAMTAPALSGTDPASPLLAGVDLGGLAIEPGGARRLTLPPWLVPVAWAAEGPLLAAGEDGARREAVLAFDPSRSDLDQLPALPVLARNLVAWATAWAPEATAAGDDVLADAPAGTATLAVSTSRGVVRLPTSGPVPIEAATPGLAGLTESGGWGERTRTLAVEPAAPARSAVPVVVRLAPGAGGATRHGWWRWLALGALALMLGEWLYAERRERERAT